MTGGVPLSTVGVEQAGGRWRYAFAFLAACALSVSRLPAQERVVEKHGSGTPEGRLLGFYSASTVFSPAGFLDDGARLSLGFELAYVPHLNAQQRRPSIDKPEATNLAPLFGRPRLAVRLPYGLTVEASWVPPVRVFDVRANLFGFALGGELLRAGTTKVATRAWATLGRVRGSMTCNYDEMVGRSVDLDSYYQLICNGHDSEDWFEPRLLGMDLIASRPLTRDVRLYAAAGARLDRTRFDIGVLTFSGERDVDHPILELSTTRPQFSLGAEWRALARWVAGAEAFYAPGSLLTARLSARYVVNR